MLLRVLSIRLLPHPAPVQMGSIGSTHIADWGWKKCSRNAILNPLSYFSWDFKWSDPLYLNKDQTSGDDFVTKSCHGLLTDDESVNPYLKLRSHWDLLSRVSLQRGESWHWLHIQVQPGTQAWGIQKRIQFWVLSSVWCCFDYFIRNCLTALLEALFALFAV